jgi:hypothetical protein
MAVHVLVVLVLLAYGARAFSTEPPADANDVLMGVNRRPHMDKGLDGLTWPAGCEAQVEVEGYFSRRIALVLNRDSYRGFSGIPDVGQGLGFGLNKNHFAWQDSAHYIQMATVRALVGNVIEPLEALGFDIDVFVQVRAPPPPVALPLLLFMTSWLSITVFIVAITCQ